MSTSTAGKLERTNDETDVSDAREETPSAPSGLRRPEDDPRFQRVRAKLTAAILILAADKPAEQIAVSELTSAAQISRTTFYKHADSPASFLAQHLIGQLEPKMNPLAHLLDDTGPGYLMRWRDIHLDLLDHVREHGDVYTHVFGADAQSVVLAMLCTYFEEVFGAYVQDFSRHIEGPQPSDLWITMAISQQVHNTIAVISSWLRCGMDESPEEVIGAYVSLVPPWQLARFSESGRTTLRRGRGMPLRAGEIDDAPPPTSEASMLLSPAPRRNLGTIPTPETHAG